jgi:hypothetical protein
VAWLALLIVAPVASFAIPVVLRDRWSGAPASGLLVPFVLLLLSPMVGHSNVPDSGGNDSESFLVLCAGLSVAAGLTGGLVAAVSRRRAGTP